MRKHNFFTFLKSIALIQLFLLILISGISVEINSQFLQETSDFKVQNILQPFSGVNINNQRAEALVKGVNVVFAGESNKDIFPNNYFKTGLPEDLMVSSIQALANPGQELTLIDNGNESEEGEGNDIELPVVKEDKDSVNSSADYSSIFKGYRVVFYCTHSAESYIPDSGKARLDGQRGLINNVSDNIAEYLRDRGLAADFIDTIHDYPEYNNSYTRSRETVSEILKSKKNLLALFDVHRDSIPGESSAETVEIKGRKSARILIIVGTNERKPHPEWKTNLAFAEKICVKAEKMYPGLVKGLRTKAGTYNQEFFPHALLLEFGSDRNTFAEAGYAGELFSDVLLEVLKEEVG
ncbi:MAG: stage II sporulation protein P [Syntrophomonas sp.]